jgi:hypothetical protein
MNAVTDAQPDESSPGQFGEQQIAQRNGSATWRLHHSNSQANPFQQFV